MSSEAREHQGAATSMAGARCASRPCMLSGACCCLHARPPAAPAHSYHAKALLVSFGDATAGPAVHVDALTREVHLAFRRLDGQVRQLGSAERAGAGGGADDAPVRLQVQRQLAQALLKLSLEFRCDAAGNDAPYPYQRSAGAASRRLGAATRKAAAQVAQPKHVNPMSCVLAGKRRRAT